MHTYNFRPQQNSMRQTISAAADNVTEASIQSIIDMLNDALDDEYRDYYKYMALAEDLTDEADSETVKSMAYDEYKHRRLLEEIYTAVTGSAPRPPQNIIQPRAGKYTIDDLTDSLFGELEGVEFYRDIMFSLKNTTLRDMLFEIMTDEQAHAAIINYGLAKNGVATPR